jgi:uncharacterized membrane protein YhhN
MKHRAAPYTATFGIAVLVYLACLVRGLEGARVATKAIPVAVLAVWVAREAARGPLRSRALFALVLSAIGDVAIEASFIAGLIAFFVAHVAYVVAFVGERRDLALARALPFAAWVAVGQVMLVPRMGDLAIPAAVYTLALGAMMWRAAVLVDRRRPWAGAIALGAVAFGASDTLIAVSRFGVPFRGAPIAIMALYWLGQALIACGVVGATRSGGRA